MNNIIALTILGFSVLTASANNNLNDISKKPYVAEVKKTVAVEKVEVKEQKINQHSMNFISKRPYLAPKN